jgi:hypothetical protein
MLFVLALIFAGTLVRYLLSTPISIRIDQAPQLQEKFAAKFSGLNGILQYLPPHLIVLRSDL